MLMDPLSFLSSGHEHETGHSLPFRIHLMLGRRMGVALCHPLYTFMVWCLTMGEFYFYLTIKFHILMFQYHISLYSHCHHVQTSSGAYPVSCPVGT